MTGPSRRGGHHLGLAFALVVAASAVWLFSACGPESYHQVAARDAHADLPGTGGALGGTGGPATGGGGGRGAGGSTAAVDGGYCAVRDAAPGDAGLATFNMSWSFDDAAGLQGWTHVGQPLDVRDATLQQFDPDDGYPAPGSARVLVPFNGAVQQIAFGYNFPTAQDLSHQVLSARVRLNSCNGPGTVVVGLAYKSVIGVYEYAATTPVDVTAASGWITLTMSIENPGGFIDTAHHDADGGLILPDPTTALEVDVIIQSNNGPYVVTDISVDSVGLSDEGTAPQDGATPDAADADATIDARDGASPGS